METVKMIRITLDTNVLPANRISEAAEKLNCEFAVITVTNRELEGTDIDTPSTTIMETAVWDESRWGLAVWGGNNDPLHEILQVISNSSFPRHRENLTSGQRRQLRDAMIFSAHVREKCDIFITSDEKAFIKGGRRESLESKYATRIMTPDQFITYCENQCPKGDA